MVGPPSTAAASLGCGPHSWPFPGTGSLMGWLLPPAASTLGPAAGVGVRVAPTPRPGAQVRCSGRQGLHPWRCRLPGRWPHRGSCRQQRPVSFAGTSQAGKRPATGTRLCPLESIVPEVRVAPVSPSMRLDPPLHSPGAARPSETPRREIQSSGPGVWGWQRLARDPVRQGQARLSP